MTNIPEIDHEIMIDCIVVSYDVHRTVLDNFPIESITKIYAYIKTFKSIVTPFVTGYKYYLIETNIKHEKKVKRIVNNFGYYFIHTTVNKNNCYTLYDKTRMINTEIAMVIIHLLDNNVPFTLSNVSKNYK